MGQTGIGVSRKDIKHVCYCSLFTRQMYVLIIWTQYAISLLLHYLAVGLFGEGEMVSLLFLSIDNDHSSINEIIGLSKDICFRLCLKWLNKNVYNVKFVNDTLTQMKYDFLLVLTWTRVYAYWKQPEVFKRSCCQDNAHKSTQSFILP